MGVTRLWTYIKNNCAECVEHVDFVQLAADTPGGIKLLVDFYSWEHFMKAKCKSSLYAETDNPYLPLCGGEYSSINDYITSFVVALRSVKIELVFYLDGAKGSSESGTKQKWKTWMQRQSEDIRRIRETLLVLDRKMPFEELNINEITRPCLQEIQNIITLQNLGCKIHFAVSGEADTYIAQPMQEEENVVGVLTNDTDFCIFPGSKLLSEFFFDIGDNMGMQSACLELKRPEKLICGLVKSDLLWRHFGFPGVESLCELSIIAGNDYTLPILNHISPYRGVVGKIAKVIGIVKEFGTAEKFPLFGSLMKDIHRLQAAVKHSRKFYSLTLSAEPTDENKDEVVSIVSSSIKEGHCPSSIFAMCKRFYWHRGIMEDTEESFNTAERAMVFLRSYIYSLLLPPDQVTVEEYGRSAERDFQQMTAMKITHIKVPSLTEVQKNSFQKNRALFHRILSHQEYYIPSFNKGFFRQYGNKLGFVCYILRYILLLNWKQNLYIEPGEFLIMCAYVLKHHDPKEYMVIKILPRPRCVTIHNWMLCLYRTSYAFLGSLLNVNHEFPIPQDLFSGAVWVAFYTASSLSPESHYKSDSYKQLSIDQVAFINKTVTDTLKDRQSIIESIVQGLFPVSL